MDEALFTACNTTHDLARLLLGLPAQDLAEDGDREETSRGARLGEISGSYFEGCMLDVTLTISGESRW